MFIYSQAANDADTVTRQIIKILAQGKTQFQEYIFFESAMHGTCVALDGDIQSCASDEAIYHEALVHPAMLAHPQPKTVLIMGGGEGATAREVLRHSCVDRVIMVDIDQEFVELCKQYIPSWGEAAFADARLEVHYQDIYEYLKNCPHQFDVVIGDLIDVHDWDSPVAALYGKEFYTLLQQHMSDDAIIATQAGPLVPKHLDGHNHIRQTLHSCFQHVASYGHIVPSFYHLWGYCIASNQALTKEIISTHETFHQHANARSLNLAATGVSSLAGAFTLPHSITDGLM